MRNPAPAFTPRSAALLAALLLATLPGDASAAPATPSGGDDPGIPVIVPAGTIVCFSSNTFHRSGFNTTSKPRRSFLCQYSPSPILTKDGTKPWCDAVPFLKDGQNIFQWPPK